MAADVYVATAQDVYAQMSMGDSIALMRDAFAALAQGRIDQPLRSIVKSPLSKGFLGLMPACVDVASIYPIPVYGAKVGTLFPDNARIGKDPHQGCVILMSGETGETLAIIDASSITALRTAAVTGLATSLLARPEADVLVLFGTGHQAEWQLRAVAEVRPLRRVLVLSRDADNARRFASAQRAHYEFSIDAATDTRTALAQADIVITATNSSTPVLERQWIRPGTHITAMGSSTPSHCEIDGATMAAASLFVDRAASTVNESGEYLNALRDGHITADVRLTELGAVVSGQAAGRERADQITLFKSLGLALEDVVMAAALRRRHELSGQGASILI